MPLAVAVVAVVSLLPALTNGQTQSALDARGSSAVPILELTWVLFAGGGIIFIAVMLLLLAALFGPSSLRSGLARHAWVVGGGIVFPVLVLSALLIYTFSAASGIVRSQQAPAAARIEVAGELWWWRVRYLDAGGKALLETANEIHIPVGQPVDLELSSGNVIHSFWVPNLAGKVDMMPGRVNRLRLQAAAPGVFRGQCAEYCGAQHAKMAFHVVALPPAEHAAWLAARAQPAAEPAGPWLRRGQALFAESRCGLCHTIRGTPADGTLGPDLTHVGSRSHIAAGTLPNGVGTIAAWITSGQHIKPGNQMPVFNQFSGEDLRALAGYLESLR